MNLNTLKDFRHGVYGCFEKARDALFNLMDALASEASARSFPELSFSPFFERSWASLYEALEDGRIDAERLRDVFLQFAPLPEPGQLVFLGIDTSNLYRPEAETAADRTLVKIATSPSDTHVASPGWVISSVVLLPSKPGQGTFVLDTARVTSSELAIEVAARQLRAVVASLVARGFCPVILGDRWYACAPFLARMTDVDAACLLRVKSNRVFYRPAPARLAGQRGATRKDGDRFQCSDPSTHGEPDETWEGLDAKGAKVEVRCWNHLHLRTARWAEISVLQVIRYGATGRARDPGSAGLSGKATVRLRWLRSARPTACATPTSMAIASTSKNCSGMGHGSRLRNGRSGGPSWSPVPTICWSWLVHWCRDATDRGKRAARSSR